MIGAPSRRSGAMRLPNGGGGWLVLSGASEAADILDVLAGRAELAP